MARGFSQASSAASVVSNSSLGHKSLRGKALSSAGSFNSHGFETDDDPYAEATPKQLQHEIDQLFAEKKRVAEEFDQLIQQRNNSRKTSGTPAALSNKPDSAASTLSLSKAQKRLSGASSVFGLSRSGNTKSSSTHLSPPASSSGQRPTNGDSLGGSEYEDARSNAKAILALSRKRERVCTRYDTQLEFLRVKLQGAELRAKLRQ